MADFVDSTSEERTVNNTMRHQYRVLSDAEKAMVTELKDEGQKYLDLLQRTGEALQGRNGREIALAKTKIEEAAMWAVKAVTA